MNIRKRKPWSEAPTWATVLLKNKVTGCFVFAESFENGSKAWPTGYSRSKFSILVDYWELVEHRPTSKKEGVDTKDEDLINLVLWGMKPLASIEKDKQPELFERVLKLYNVLSIHRHDVGLLTITLPINRDLHQLFKLLCSPKAAMVIRSREEKQILLGRLFGYKEKDIEEFINSDLAKTCECKQCKFPL